MKPPLKWAGGKRWLAPFLAPVFEHYQKHRWCEPFAGSAALAFLHEPENVYLNDNLPPLINFYSCLAQGYAFPIPSSVTAEQYYAARDAFNAHNSGDNAPLFYLLNHAGFNGLYRVNSKGRFNVPYGGERTIPSLDVTGLSRLMMDWEITCHDFAIVLEDIEKEHQDNHTPFQIAYIDPPYDDGFTDYSGVFNWGHRLKLIGMLARATFPLIYSERATPRVKSVLQDWELTGRAFRWFEIEGPRRISADGDRTPVGEVLAFRNVHDSVVDAVYQAIRTNAGKD